MMVSLFATALIHIGGTLSLTTLPATSKDETSNLWGRFVFVFVFLTNYFLAQWIRLRLLFVNLAPSLSLFLATLFTFRIEGHSEMGAGHGFVFACICVDFYELITL